MTKYAKCTVCGYVIAIPDDKNSDDYVCPNDGNTLTNATKTEYDAYMTRAQYNVVTKTSDYTASGGDCVLVDASSGDVTITLPEPSKATQVNIKKIDQSTNIVTVVPNGGNIDGKASKEISTQYESYLFISDGTNWYII